VVAWLAVAGFMRYIQTRSLIPFAVYRVVLGLIVLGAALAIA
jgi:undecaprenyl pyrophosphate phosphatase UppP